MLVLNTAFFLSFIPWAWGRGDTSVPERSRVPGIAPGEVPTNSAGIMFLPRMGCRGWSQPGAVGGPAASLENWKPRWNGCQRAANCWERLDLWWEERKRHLSTGLGGGGREAPVGYWIIPGLGEMWAHLLVVILFLHNVSAFHFLKFIFWYSFCLPSVKVIQLLLNVCKSQSSLVSHPLPFLSSRNSLQTLSGQIWNWVLRHFILQILTPGWI